MIFSSKKSFQSGFTLIEVLVVVAISGMLMLSLSNVIGEVSNTQTSIKESNDLNREAAFVMRRLVQLISRTSSLDEHKNTSTDVHYHLVPDPQRDINKDGFADADSDKDGDIDGDDLSEETHFQWKDGVFKERDLMPYDVGGDGKIDNKDKVEYTVSEKITSFTVVYTTSGRYPLFDVTLVFGDALGNQVTLATKIRVGGRL